MKKTEVHYLQPGGIIWKVLPDDQCQYLVIESRDSVKRKTLWSVVALEKETLLLEGIPAPKPWWIGIKAAVSGKVIFQGYKESQTPEIKGVYVMDGTTGRESWKEEEKVFHSFSGKDKIVLQAKEQEQTLLYEADLQSGKIIRQLKEEDYTEISLPETGIVFPLLYTEENIHYKTIAGFLEHNKYKALGPIEYLEHEDKIMVSFYIQEGKTLINIVWLVNEDGETLLEDRMAEGTEGVGMASFFLMNERLIYIKDKTKIALALLS